MAAAIYSGLIRTISKLETTLLKTTLYRTPDLFSVPRYRLSEDANADRCNRCQSAIWVVLAGGVWKVKVDTTRLNPESDLNCYLAQIPTFEIRRSAKSFIVDFRTKIRLMAANDLIKLAEHRCEMAFMATHPDYFTNAAKVQTDGIPF